MSHPSSNRDYQNRNLAGGYLNDDEQLRTANPDHMFNALMDQYLSNASPSASAAPMAYFSSLRQYTDPQSAQPFQQGTAGSLSGGHVHASRSPAWNSAAPNPGYEQFSGNGQPNLSVPRSGAHLHGVQQPSFSDLMREMGHEHSRALHEAARRAPFNPFAPTLASPQQGLTSGPGEYLYTRTPSLIQPSSHHASRSSSGSVSGGSTGGHQRVENITAEQDDSLFEMFPCDMCTASFSRRHDLERHRRGHSGEAPYTCEGCGAGFTRSDGRGRHWKLQPACEARHFERGGTGKRRSGAPFGTGPGPNTTLGSGA